MQYEYYHKTLEELFNSSKELSIDQESKIVIFSDLHMGNGRSLDDFRPNAHLFEHALQEYYIQNGFQLILNGDVEELHRYSLQEIRSAWSHIYALFDLLHREKRLYKIYGNHDSKLFALPGEDLRYPLLASLKLDYHGHKLFFFHGHQASFFYEKFNELMGLLLRVFAKPLRIRNYSVAHNKEKAFTIEKRSYEFSRRLGIISILGHTHRPLFESMSKLDALNYRIESLLRRHEKSSEDNRSRLEEEIRTVKEEIERYINIKGEEQTISNLYSSHTVIPSVFNSGCVIGKRGMTAIEISEGKMYLVHWFDKDIDKRYRSDSQLHETHSKGRYYRTVLKKDSLDYIFTKIRLLS